LLSISLLTKAKSNSHIKEHFQYEMSAKSNPAETLLKKLRKLDQNMVCPNCDTAAQVGVGFGNVCVKFKTFICDLCKTSHQAISHRVKSITMSNWTMDEVNELLDVNGGGNRAARHVWLFSAPPPGGRYPGGSRPRAGDRVEIFKQFIMDVYEYGKFKATVGYQPSDESRSVSPVTPVSNSSSAKYITAQPVHSTSLGPPVRVTAPVTAALPVPNLLDDDFFATPSSTVSSTTSDPFSATTFDPFGPVSTPVAATDSFGVSSTATAAFQPSTVPVRSAAPVANPFFRAAPAAPTLPASMVASTSLTDLDLLSELSLSSISQKSVVQQSPSPAVALTLQPPASFDPFGDTLLVPTSTSPIGNGFGMTGGQQPSPHSPIPNSASILSLYNNAPPNTMQGGYRANGSNSTAISQIGMAPSGPPMMMMTGGGRPVPTRPMMNSMGSGVYSAAPRPIQPPQPSSFDFVQDNMKLHLNSSGTRTPPPNPFR
jgi:hypothetical protein